jgi:hypothetical protein
MKSGWDQGNAGSGLELARRRLAAEFADVKSAIALVSSGSASRVILGGLQFGDELARRFRLDARSSGVRLESIVRPDDTGCDLVARRLDD